MKLYKFIPTNPPHSPSWLASRYKRLELRHSPDGNEQWLNWVIRLKENRKPVGLIEVTIHGDQSALLAYTVFVDEWGKGYAREACGWVINELFRQFLVKEFISHVDRRNARSISLLEALNFSLVKTISSADYFKNAKSDEYVYSLRDRGIL